MSPKDLNTLDVLPQLIEAGVRSFKIEGRMKRPEYVAVVTDIYRRAIDSYFAGNYHVPEEDRKNIEQIFNRDFTTAYLEKKPGRTMISDRRPNNRGVLIGRVASLSKDFATGTIKLDKDLHLGDGLEFWVSVGGRVGTTVEKMKCGGKETAAARAGSQVTIAVPRGIRLNDRVFRTYDNELMQYAAQFFGPDHKHRLPVSVLVTAHLGQPMIVTMTDEDGNQGYGQTEFIVEKARKHALDEAAVRKQIDRLGTTEFSLGELILEVDDGVMVPMSEINEARRLAAEQLTHNRLEAFLPSRKKVTWQNAWLKERENHTLRKHSELAVHVDTLEKAKIALDAGADVLILGGDSYSLPLLRAQDYQTVAGWAKTRGKQWVAATSRIVSEGQLGYFAHAFKEWKEWGADGFLLANNGLVEMARETGVPLWADYGLNIFNSQSILFWLEQGFAGVTLSPELTLAQVGAWCGNPRCRWPAWRKGPGNDGVRILRHRQFPGAPGQGQLQLSVQAAHLPGRPEEGTLPPEAGPIRPDARAERPFPVHAGPCKGYGKTGHCPTAPGPPELHPGRSRSDGSYLPGASGRGKPGGGESAPYHPGTLF